MDCKYCQKEVQQVVGKRAKEFCNNSCRSNFWYAQNKKGKQVKKDPALTYPHLYLPKAEIEEEKIKVTWFPPHHDSPEAIQAQIDKLEADIKGFGTGQLGQIMKNKTQDKINKLKKQLK